MENKKNMKYQLQLLTKRTDTTGKYVGNFINQQDLSAFSKACKIVTISEFEKFFNCTLLWMSPPKYNGVQCQIIFKCGE